MLGNFANSIRTPLLSVEAALQPSWMATDIMFYVNLVLVFCALIEFTTFIVLCRKTSCAFVIGFAAVILYGFGLIMYVVQLVMYVRGHSGAAYTVYFCMAMFCCGFILGGVYCVLLSRNAHRVLCLVAGITNIFPPVGAIASVVLSYRIRKDSRVHALVFNGYAYTYAALAAFCDKNGAEFIDMSGEENFEQLTPKQANKLLKSLKTDIGSVTGKFSYAAALMNYRPEKTRKALRIMSKAAEANYAPALFNLGYFYEIGSGVKRDHKKARAYYERAVAAGDVDAELRIALIDIDSGKTEDGINKLKELIAGGDICAKYNSGVCCERGLGVPRNIDKAVDIYTECANAGLYAAQKRIFAIAAQDINSAQNGQFFRKVTDREFFGSFDLMNKGLIEIKKRKAADAANLFLSVVKRRDKWEGLARCLVGTLYIDCGKLPEDKHNGSEYIKSAFDMLPGAKDIYAVVPRSIIKAVSNKSNAQVD